MNIQKIAKKLINQFKVRKNEDGELFTSFKIDSIRYENKHYRLLSNVVHRFQGNIEFKYDTIHNFLEWIIDSEHECIDDIQDMMYNFLDTEIPVYTSDLTAWLASSNYNVFWIEDAVQEHGQSEGFKILSSAYYLAAQDLCYELLSEMDNEFIID